MKFRIAENARVYEFTIDTESGQDMTADYVELFEQNTGASIGRLSADDAYERGYDYRIGGASFEYLIEYFEAIEREQENDETILDKIIVWSDYND